MLVWRERLQSVPVMSLQTGGQLALATQLIINPHDLQIIAFYCEGPKVEASPAVLHVADIREFGELGMIINDSSDIMPLDDDLVRLQEILQLHFEFIGMKVIDTGKRKLGKVSNFVVDTNTFQIVKFSVKRPLLQSLQEEELIIARQQIRKITHDEIVVSMPTVEEKSSNKANLRAMPAIENPFRRQRPVENIGRSH